MIDPTTQLANFKIIVNNIQVGIDSAKLKNGNDSVIIFSLTKPVIVNDIITLSYSEGEMASADGVKLVSFSKYPVTNIVPALALLSASTYNNAKTIITVYNKPMADPSALLSNFRIYVNNSSVTLDSVRLKSGNDSVMVITLRNPAKTGDNILFFYYAGSVESSAGEKLATIRFYPVVNNILTGIDTQKANEISIFPNPAGNNIYFKGNTTINKVFIFNTMGQLILEKVLNSEDVQIDVSALPAGTYLITAYSDKALVLKTKFIRIN